MNQDLASDPILAAVDAFSGSFIDLDRSLVVRADEFRRVVGELETFLTRQRVTRDDRVIMAIGNGPMFPAVLAAILLRGGSPILLHGETPPAEIRRVHERFGATHFISDALREEALGDIGAVGGRFSCARWAVGLCARIADTAPRTEGEHAEPSEIPPAVPLHPTSGTTGMPKLALRPGSAAVAEARHYIEAIHIDMRDVVLCTIPMSHAYGFGMCTMVPLLANATVASMRRYTPMAALQALHDHGVTIYPSAPFALDLLMNEGRDGLPPPPRCITSAGAPLPERTARQVRQRWGVTVRPLYGTTETGGISVAGSDHEASDASSVGPPMRGVSVDVRATGEQAERIGSLWVKSSSMMAGYLERGRIDRSGLVEGWFDTGDLAQLDDEGTIRLRGRASEVINVFGMKVLPMEVEDVIALIPEVDQVKVYGVPNRFGSNSVTAAIVADGELSETTVRAHCRKHLVGYKCPEHIKMLDHLPRSASGKVLVAELP